MSRLSDEMFERVVEPSKFFTDSFLNGAGRVSHCESATHVPLCIARFARHSTLTEINRPRIFSGTLDFSTRKADGSPVGSLMNAR